MIEEENLDYGNEEPDSDEQETASKGKWFIFGLIVGMLAAGYFLIKILGVLK